MSWPGSWDRDAALGRAEMREGLVFQHVLKEVITSIGLADLFPLFSQVYGTSSLGSLLP